MRIGLRAIGRFLSGDFRKAGEKRAAKGAARKAEGSAAKAAKGGAGKKAAVAGAAGAAGGYWASKGFPGLDDILPDGIEDFFDALTDWRVIAAIVLIVMAMFAK